MVRIIVYTSRPKVSTSYSKQAYMKPQLVPGAQSLSVIIGPGQAYSKCPKCV